MIHVYEAFYECPEHGEVRHPTTDNANAADKMVCPRCKREIPLKKVVPMRDVSFNGRLRTKDR